MQIYLSNLRENKLREYADIHSVPVSKVIGDFIDSLKMPPFKNLGKDTLVEKKSAELNKERGKLNAEDYL